ncbi:peptidase M48-like protein [Stackebrandtia endophytica]|uniref:Peptidase M48-like protein n=1 Tax=Stackebrandtia endophytica TaxID=1496996 RepID=A0A543B125_9ACTN|nr:M56 family metallopeptidase [Stackebrandtia endophytica]TQL78480.1 peptidase M48-like protein [Stackebrandtia endophytica]
MSVLLIPGLLSVVLLVTALGGPTLVRAAAPILMRFPRAATVLLLGSLLLWLLAAAALSLLSAWIVTGPSVLPGPFAEVCRRCIEAASPFSFAGSIDTSVPVALLVLLPALAMLAVIGRGSLTGIRRYRATRAVSREVADRARSIQIDGYPVLLIPDSRAVAFSLPRRHGGIVISEGLRTRLDPAELTAVIAHENAHVRQRHHLVMTVVAALHRPLSRVPLVSSVADAVPHYLEIAADNAARGRSGTPALAGALLKLAVPDEKHATDRLASPLLHAAGPDRIRQLVAPAGLRSAVMPISALCIQLAALAVVVAAVHGPYLYVVLTGCRLPA